jgi:signal transduction histidine kinase
VLAGLDGTAGAELVTTLGQVPHIIGDRNQLQSLFTNLVLNATEAIGPGQNGRIAVETGQHDSWVSVLVCDNGCGMSDEFIKNSLFRPFRTTKKKGIGIGMFQAKLIVEAHKGAIQVKSAPGEGTTFRVLLPLSGKAKSKSLPAKPDDPEGVRG